MRRVYEIVKKSGMYFVQYYHASHAAATVLKAPVGKPRIVGYDTRWFLFRWSARRAARKHYEASIKPDELVVEKLVLPEIKEGKSRTNVRSDIGTHPVPPPPPPVPRC